MEARKEGLTKGGSEVKEGRKEGKVKRWKEGKMENWKEGRNTFDGPRVLPFPRGLDTLFPFA
jgi:hypothetical protein